jgi:asparagine synthase (glutamine-hydrolysing)
MIGGYLFQKIDNDVNARIQEKIASCSRVDVWDIGFLFFSHPALDGRTQCAASPNTVALSEDLLICSEGDSGYRQIDLENDFLEIYRKEGTKAFDAIQCDFRMAIVSKKDSGCSLQLVSHRAGAGRMYYHKLATGILFSSDLRFLLDIIPMDVNPLGIYSILKYGSIPDPLTISRNISAVPVAHYADFDLNSGKDSTHPFFQFHFDCRNDTRQVSLDRVQSALKGSAAFLGKYSSAMLLSGGIDSSLYGCYLNESRHEPLKAFYCAFGSSDPEYPYAAAIARKLGVDLKVATMESSDALQALDDIVRLSDRPFSDFSSLPIVFLLKFIREHLDRQGIVIECNGGDDCFGFPALQDESKYRYKHAFPKVLKKALASYLRNFNHWKWESHEGIIAKVAALADVHENSPLNYYLVQAPVHYMGFNAAPEWDETLQELIEKLSRSCSQNYQQFRYEEKITVRQLLFINSPRWTAKALSVSDSLGLRVIYPYVWRDILREQGKIPWETKVHNGIVKWPLKKLLEDFMPQDFIYRKKSGFVPPLVQWLTDPVFNRKARDLTARSNGFVSQIIPIRVLDELFADALNSKRLRFPLLNTLWGAIFTESWIHKYSKSITVS